MLLTSMLSIQKLRYESGSDACFALFLTVHTKFFEKIVSNIEDSVIKNYIKQNLKGITGEKRLARLLKAYTFYTLGEIFKKHGFHIELLPPIYYMGTGTYFDENKIERNHWMLTFTVLGTPFGIEDPPG